MQERWEFKKSEVVELMGNKHAVTTFGVDWNSPPLYPSVVIWSLSNSISSPNISRTIWKCHVMWHGGFVDEGKFRKLDIHIACGKRKTQGDRDLIAEQTMNFNMLKLLKDS